MDPDSLFTAKEQAPNLCLTAESCRRGISAGPEIGPEISVSVRRDREPRREKPSVHGEVLNWFIGVGNDAANRMGRHAFCCLLEPLCVSR